MHILRGCSKLLPGVRAVGGSYEFGLVCIKDLLGCQGWSNKNGRTARKRVRCMDSVNGDIGNSSNSLTTHFSTDALHLLLIIPAFACCYGLEGGAPIQPFDGIA